MNLRVHTDHDEAAHLRPRLQELLAALRLDVTYECAAGDHLVYRDGSGREVEVLDLVGGYGSLLLGHSHPRLVAEAQRLLAAGRPMHVQGANRPYAQRLAAELSRRAGGDYAVVLGNSGAEAVEAGLKHAMLRTGGRTFIALEGAFHGKTLGAVQLTSDAFYRDAFELTGMRVLHVPPDEPDALEGTFAAAGEDLAGFVFEPVLGEGGVRPLSREFVQRAASLCRSTGAAFIADECQTGVGRTGHFLAAHALGVQPDTILLSKALGGGLAKISACLLSREHYDHGFDLRHTSTFADDDYSCAIALQTLELIDEDLLATVRRSGAALLDRLQELQRARPGVIRAVRGAGLMVGVEFRDLSEQGDGFLLRYLSSQEELVKLLAGYFLHEHRIRVLPLLSDPFTLRLQPSAFLSLGDAERCVGALDDVCAKLEANDCVTLSRFLGVGEEAGSRGPVLPGEPGEHFDYGGARPRRAEREAPGRRVAWLCHLVDSDDLVALEPGLSELAPSERESILRHTAGSAAPIAMSSVEVRSRTGESVWLESILLPFTSSWVQACMEAGDLRLARGLVQQGVELARDLGCGTAALGQYTSIITANGTRLDAGTMGLTSGNSYAVALAVEAVRRAMRLRRVDPASATLAVVGAAGNIGRTCAAMLGPSFGRTLLIGSGAPGASLRLRRLAKTLRFESVELADDPFAACTADVVVSAPNAATATLFAAHLRPTAIVCDLSVPASVHSDVARERPDVLSIKGGIARLPHGEDVELPGFPLPRGQVYACMAEGLLLGLEGVAGRAFTGALRLEGVEQIGRIARRHGFELADYKTNCVLGSEADPGPDDTTSERRSHATG